MEATTDMTVEQLDAELDKRGLPKTGNKEEKVERLNAPSDSNDGDGDDDPDEDVWDPQYEATVVEDNADLGLTWDRNVILATHPLIIQSKDEADRVVKAIKKLAKNF